MTINDGGPAFPRTESSEHYDHGSERYVQEINSVGGMSLRDYFAAKALLAIMSTPEMGAALVAEANRLKRNPEAVVSEAAYEQANAMIAEREKTK